MEVGDDGFVGHESLTRCSSRVSPTGRPKQERLGDASTGKSRLKAMSVPVLTLIFTHILPLSVYIIHTHKYWTAPANMCDPKDNRNSGVGCFRNQKQELYFFFAGKNKNYTPCDPK
jgi:hypothetical protein